MQLCKRLEKARVKVVEWGQVNYVEFYNMKDETIAFMRKMKQELKRKIADARFIVRGHTMRFNMEATRCLRFYIDTGLQFRASKNLTLEKARRAEDKVRRLVATRGLA